jgi:tetratricopeptide (TPR) repeat protein
MLKPARAKQTPDVVIFHWIAISLVLLLFASSNFSARNSSQPAVIHEFQEARAAEQQGYYAATLTHYQHILTLNRRIAQVYSNMGLDYYRLKRYPQAAEALKNALKLQPDLLGAQVMLVLLCYNM